MGSTSRMSARWSGSAIRRSSTSRIDPPAARMPNTSYTERSNENDVTMSSWSADVTSYVRFTQSIRFTTLRWRTATALGSPVEPDVKIA